MNKKDQILLEQAYQRIYKIDEAKEPMYTIRRTPYEKTPRPGKATGIDQSKQRLLSRIKPEFQNQYKDLDFNGSYRDHADILNKAEELGHLKPEASSSTNSEATYKEEYNTNYEKFKRGEMSQDEWTRYCSTVLAKIMGQQESY
tara:strand:+ start:1907 stop:2338 length:432 start_codon:yes stop_codon:yes gene_type:complete